jgi:hypothetical protein
MERRSKYNARPVEADGYRFDSRAEYARYAELRLLLDAGVISSLVVHPRFVIVPKDEHGKALYYEADFWYTENGAQVVEDVKGVKTAVYQLKKRLFLARYPGRKFVEIT